MLSNNLLLGGVVAVVVLVQAALTIGYVGRTIITDGRVFAPKIPLWLVGVSLVVLVSLVFYLPEWDWHFHKSYPRFASLSGYLCGILMLLCLIEGWEQHRRRAIIWLWVPPR